MRYLKSHKQLKEFTVLADDREKNPWCLPFKVETKRLRTGDYTIKGYEDVIAIEKKSGLIELLTDLSNGYRKTFERFLKRMSVFPIKCMVVEDVLNERSISRALSHIHYKSGGKARLTERTVYYWIAEITMTYNIPIVFADKMTVLNVLPDLFKRAVEQANEL